MSTTRLALRVRPFLWTAQYAANESAISSVRRVASGLVTAVEQAELVLDVVPELVAHHDPRADVAEPEGVVGRQEPVAEDELVGDALDGRVGVALGREGVGVQRPQRVVEKSPWVAMKAATSSASSWIASVTAVPARMALVAAMQVGVEEHVAVHGHQLDVVGLDAGPEVLHVAEGLLELLARGTSRAYVGSVSVPKNSGA